MRYFLLGFLLVCVVVISVAGLRGSRSQQPPLEVFPDMDRQLRLRPQTLNTFFPDHRSSRPLVAGTIPRGEPISLSASDPSQLVHRFEEAPVTTGRARGSTNFVQTVPIELTPPFLGRGRERYEIFCAACHGPLGDGNGITRKLGMATVANLHDRRIVSMHDGELFHVITHGRNTMLPYAAQIPIEDRWAIIAYLRALHLSRLGGLEDVPPAQRPMFTR
jgi:hypothetical protein